MTALCKYTRLEVQSLVVLENFRKSLDDAMRALKKLPRIDKESLEEFIATLRQALIEGDVNVDIAVALTERIKKQAFDQHISEEFTREDFIKKLIT